MTDPVRELKTRAEILHRKIESKDIRAIQRLRVFAEHRRLPAERLNEVAGSIQRRDCLAVIAAELGFSNWHHLKIALTGEGEAEEFGTLLYPGTAAHINLWYASYEDAVAVREARRSYLLAYKRQYLVVDRYFIESLGLDPDDPDWRGIGFDWVRPLSVAARTRLYGKLIARLPREGA